MKKVLEVISVVGAIIIIGVMLFLLLFDKPPTFHPETLDAKIVWQGRMKYVVFITGNGQIEVKNYTIDSLEVEAQKKFIGPDTDK